MRPSVPEPPGAHFHVLPPSDVSNSAASRNAAPLTIGIFIQPCWESTKSMCALPEKGPIPGLGGNVNGRIDQRAPASLVEARSNRGPSDPPSSLIRSAQPRVVSMKKTESTRSPAFSLGVTSFHWRPRSVVQSRFPSACTQPTPGERSFIDSICSACCASVEEARPDAAAKRMPIRSRIPIAYPFPPTETCTHRQRTPASEPSPLNSETLVGVFSTLRDCAQASNSTRSK